ncbi:hypothetical protein niasHT_031368 [Heterodera trifolii]|uniref:Uncharacterized protein n=1 Tax=Heterodera trifolii TaxID=157864 RepID=A0ABD2IRP3_9BILA
MVSCHMMWCGQSNYGRIITSHPALEGTVCGTNQWCSLGRCVPWGSGGGGFATPLAPRPPLQPQPVATVPMLTTVVPATTSQVDGQWSEWSPFECHQCFCSEISGAIGVTLSERNCSNPAPQNGGAECSGPAHRAAVCSHKCPQERQSVNQYISAKCTEHQRVRQDPELTGTGSQLTRFPQRACKVFCDVKNEDGAPRNYRFYGDDLPDGAPCGWNRYCLNGECTALSCDSSLLLIAEYGEHCPAKEERCPTNAVDEPKTTAQLNVPRHFAIGQWEQWSSWSPCTASCGNAGVQFRSRVCPAGGRCDGGPSSESQPCNRICQNKFTLLSQIFEENQSFL